MMVKGLIINGSEYSININIDDEDIDEIGVDFTPDKLVASINIRTRVGNVVSKRFYYWKMITELKIKH